jgi:purine-binding chemotaxis protein CheW
MNLLHVVFKVAGAEYALPASEVLQMESFTGATSVPGSPPHVLGIVQLRGRVIPVIDLRARFGLPAQAPGPDARLVVAQKGERTVALLVDVAREVLSIPEEALKPPPRLMGHQAEGFVKSVAQIGNRLVMAIDFSKVIGEELLHVDQR